MNHIFINYTCMSFFHLQWQVCSSSVLVELPIFSKMIVPVRVDVIPSVPTNTAPALVYLIVFLPSTAHNTAPLTTDTKQPGQPDQFGEDEQTISSATLIFCDTIRATLNPFDFEVLVIVVVVVVDKYLSLLPARQIRVIPQWLQVNRMTSPCNPSPTSLHK